MNDFLPFDEPFTDQEKAFIKNHINDNVEKLLLNGAKSKEKNIKKIAEQIAARQKIKEKHPNWFNNLDLILPKSISLEQSSSEFTANYKANLIAGELFLDLTGGMGIDFFAMCENFKKAIYLEQNNELTKIAAHNSAQLGYTNCIFENINSLQFLQNFTGKASWIYVDPARRDANGGKVFSLADCEPDIITAKSLLFDKSENILIKCSPILDISLAIQQLENVAKVYILCVENEVKELVFELNQVDKSSTEIEIVNKKGTKLSKFKFDFSQEKALEYQLGPIQKYLYEPNAGIMKSGAFKSISKRFDLNKLHINTHLYTSDSLIDNFPGRIFEVIDSLKVDKKAIYNKLNNGKANLSIRNFPGSVAELKKKLGIIDGGNEYLFACTNYLNEKMVLQTKKIS
jgi:THUMP domain-like